MTKSPMLGDNRRDCYNATGRWRDVVGRLLLLHAQWSDQSLARVTPPHSAGVASDEITAPAGSSRTIHRQSVRLLLAIGGHRFRRPINGGLHSQDGRRTEALAG